MNELFDGSVHPLYAVMAAVCAIIVSVVLIRTRKDKNNEKTDIHVILYRWVVFFCLQDAVWGVFAAHVLENDIILFITSGIFHLSSAVMTLVWVFFLISIIKKVRYEGVIKGISIFLVAVQTVLLISNFYNNFMFYIDEEGFYTSTGYRYILFYLQFAVYIAIGIISLSVILIKKKDTKKLHETVNTQDIETPLSREDGAGEGSAPESLTSDSLLQMTEVGDGRDEEDDCYSILAVFFINLAPLVAGFFQMLYPDAPANSIGFAVGCIIVYTYIAEANEKKIAKLNAEKAYHKIFEIQNMSLREKEASLVQALQEAELANNAKSTFLFNMSHDIRTPMNAIIGYTEMALRHKEDGATIIDSLRKIRSSSDFLLSIINDILDMARIESGKVKIEESVTCISEANEALTQMIRINASAKDITVHCDAEALVDDYVWSDQNHVNQIVTNLLSNAIKYTPEGGEIWHCVRQVPCSREGYGCYQIIVRDNGIGMSKEFLSRIFDQFERENTSTVSGIQGTGLGMSIVKNLIELMDGKIDIESEPGKGTKVTVTLEHRIATEDETAEYRNRNKPVEVMRLGQVIDDIHVLLVDDNEMNREIAFDILEESGISVEVAEDGDIAYEIVKNSKPGQFDAVLMDVQMPRMNGYEATKLIRKLEQDELANIPIIAMTANAFEEDKRNAIDAGMNAHLSKPIDVHKLVNLLRTFKNVDKNM